MAADFDLTAKVALVTGGNGGMAWPLPAGWPTPVQPS